jgi:Zn-dependent protease
MADDDTTAEPGPRDSPPGWGYGVAPPGAPPGGGPPAPGAQVPPPGWGPPPGSQALPPGWGPPPGWDAERRRLPVRPSPIFGGLVAGFVASGILCARGVGNPRIWVFAFVALGWVISLCLHEFFHAAVAWKAGDRSVEAKGYLTLDPRRYINSQTSIILPIIIVLIGGIALPGGAVMVDRRFVRDRRMQSLISAAGPLTNLACAVLCALPLATGLVRYDPRFALGLPFGVHDQFAAALAFLALLEVVASILNALPIPGFDGFGVIAPYLPQDTVRSLMPIARYAWLGMFLLLFSSAAANGAFFGFCDHALAALGVSSNLGAYGQFLFTFWRKQ